MDGLVIAPGDGDGPPVKEPQISVAHRTFVGGKLCAELLPFDEVPDARRAVRAGSQHDCSTTEGSDSDALDPVGMAGESRTILLTG